MANETYTQVAPDSTGDKIRTTEASILQGSGGRITVSMQVIQLADSDGKIIGQYSAPIHFMSSQLESAIEDLADEIRKLRTIIELNSGISL